MAENWVSKWTKVAQKEDRLSSLPNSILINVLSRLNINEAASTSVLSRRWRHLWTGVSSFNFWRVFGPYSANHLSVIVDILQQLTSPKLYAFHLRLNRLGCTPTCVVSCFREICCRNVEHVSITADLLYSPYYNALRLPCILFQTQSLVSLQLCYRVRLPETANIELLLPNLKNLGFDTLLNLPCWLGTLFSSCPLLEDLVLKFDLFSDNYANKSLSDLRICAPNLKSLLIEMNSPPGETPPPKILIDAPALINLTIIDCTFCYYFVQIPPELSTATIDSGKGRRGEGEWVDDKRDEDYVHQLSKFIAGMSSVRELVLKLTLIQPSQKSIYNYLNFLNRRCLTIRFPNLVSLRTIMDDVGLKTWKDLLLSLHCFPNLSNLYVNFESDPAVMHYNWDEPDSVPECLMHRLKKLEIKMKLDMNEDELKLLGYILSNALVLEKLRISVSNNKKGEAELWNAGSFCNSLFRLPRASSTCEIVFSSAHIVASSIGFNNRSLKCKLSF